MTTTAEAPTWARGFELSQLEALASIFEEHDGNLPLSPFTKFRERDIASVLAGGQLWTAGGAAAIVVQEVRSNRTVRDFAGNSIGRMAPGDLFVSRIACRKGAETELVDLLLETDFGAGPGTLWLQLWQEHPTDRAIARKLGLHHAGTKIRASSELMGVWTSGPTKPPIAAEEAGLAKLWLEVPEWMREEARREAESLSYAQHYSGYNKAGSWTALSLRAFGPAGHGALVGDIEKPAEMSKAWKRENEERLAWECQPTALLQELPACAALEDLLPGEKQRSRLMRLEPGGGELTRHADITDPEAGTQEGKVLRCHIPIVSNPEVRFRMWQLDGSQEEAVMAPGEAWYLDTRKPHTAKNGGDSVRIHLVVDVFSSPALLELLGEGAPIAEGGPDGTWVW